MLTSFPTIQIYPGERRISVRNLTKPGFSPDESTSTDAGPGANRSPIFHAERWVGKRFSLADGTSARRLESIPLPEHKPAPPAFGRNLRQPAPLGTEAFPKVFQVIRDLFFRPSDGEGDFLCGKRTFLQESADLMPYRLRFLRLDARKIPVVPHALSYAAADRRAAPPRSHAPWSWFLPPDDGIAAFHGLIILRMRTSIL